MQLQTQTVQTMSSHEIAELTGKRHDNVVRDIRVMLTQLGGERGVLTFEHTQLNPQNQQLYKYFSLPKRETLILVSGYSVELRAKIIDRWQELEAAQGPQLPKTMAQALRLAAEQAEQLEQQAQALALAAPKAEFVDKYVQATTGSKGFRQVCKLLNVKEPVFRKFLKDKGVMYHLGGEWVPHAQHIQAGRFETKAGVAEHGDTSHAYNQAMFTAKGVSWIAGEWAKHQVAQATVKEVAA